MKIISNTGGLANTNAFLVADEATKLAVLFDAPDHTVGPLLDEVDRHGWTLAGLWLTHGHFDHLADHAEVTKRFPYARLLIHKLDEPKLTSPGSRMLQLPFVIPPGKAHGYLEDEQTLQIGGLMARVIFTPGHSPGHVMFHFPAENLLIGGDLIIGGAVGRTDLPDSNQADLIRSVQRVMKLPRDTQLLGGHGGPTTLEQELKTNDYVRSIVSLKD